MNDKTRNFQGQLMLRLARYSIGRRLGVVPKDLDPSYDAAFLDEKQGVFVTLHKHGDLRGCIGNIEPVKSLGQGIRENACHAAFNDNRFKPLTPEEFDEVDIEVSVLSIPAPLVFKTSSELVETLEPNVHGVIIEKGGARATFLPQVWEQLPACDMFLSHLCQKAGLEPDAWTKDGLTVYTYTVQAFAEDPPASF